MTAGRTLFLSFLMCIATGIVTYLTVERHFKKIAVVDAVKLFDKFNMKKELEERAKVKLQQISKDVDSIGNKLQLARASRDTAESKRLAYMYSYINGSLEKEYKASNQAINEQVWKRLNPMIEEYGKKRGMQLIVGANGMGSVLYNSDYFDLTDDMIKFVNKKYEEGN